MGRLIIFVFFFIAFIFFIIIKFLIIGTKAAYDVVYGNDIKDKKIEELILRSQFAIQNFMREKYSKDPNELPLIISHMTPMIQSLFLENGYKLSTIEARKIVIESILNGKFASKEEINNVQFF